MRQEKGSDECIAFLLHVPLQLQLLRAPVKSALAFALCCAMSTSKCASFVNLWMSPLQAMIYDNVLHIVGKENAPHEPQFESRISDKFDEVEDPELLKPAFLSKFTAKLQRQSAVGFIGLAEHHPMQEVSLYSCIGMWSGCIPTNAPALVYHHGSGAFGYDKEYLMRFRPAVLRSLDLWLAMATGAGL